MCTYRGVNVCLAYCLNSVLVGTYNQKKTLCSWGFLRGCEISLNLRLTSISSSSIWAVSTLYLRRPPGSTTASSPARAARDSSSARCRTRGSTPAWRTATARSTRPSATAASSAASRSACRRGWCWQVGGNISNDFHILPKIFARNLQNICSCSRGSHARRPQLRGRVQHVPLQGGCSGEHYYGTILHHTQRILIRGHVNNNLTVFSVCSTSTRNTRRRPACPSRPGC